MKPSILYLDDEPDNLVVFQASFEDHFDVWTTSDPLHALELANEHEFQVVVADQRMAGMSGCDFFETLREAHPRAKRVMLTAYTDSDSMLLAINAGQVFYFLHKPWDRNTLLSVLIRAVDAYDLSLRLERKTAALEAQNEELRSTQESLKQANAAKSDFLANMSHEIRTPMTAILGYTDLLLDSSLSDEERADHAQTIRRNGEFLLTIINDILDLSKIEAGKMEIVAAPFSPRELVSELATFMRPRAGSKSLQFQVEFEGAMPSLVRTDGGRLRQILMNLIGNAVKFTEQGFVRVVTRCVSGADGTSQLTFQVADSGIGMTQEQIARLFQPFSQVDNSSTRRFGGTGLGLTISKWLAEMLGGHLSVASNQGEGSVFTLTIPTGVSAAEDTSSTAGNDGAQPAQQAAAVRSPLHGRILLAEDGPDNQRLISFLLKKRGADVVVAENGQVALQAVLAAEDEHPFDLILMDMQMPLMDGYAATRALRTAGFQRPIIALTAHAMSGDRDRCLAAGCDDYMTKPIETEDFFRLVRRWLSGAPRGIVQTIPH